MQLYHSRRILQGLSYHLENFKAYVNKQLCLIYFKNDLSSLKSVIDTPVSNIIFNRLTALNASVYEPRPWLNMSNSVLRPFIVPSRPIVLLS